MTRVRSLIAAQRINDAARIASTHRDPAAALAPTARYRFSTNPPPGILAHGRAVRAAQQGRPVTSLEAVVPPQRPGPSAPVASRPLPAAGGRSGGSSPSAKRARGTGGVEGGSAGAGGDAQMVGSIEISLNRGNLTEWKEVFIRPSGAYYFHRSSGTKGFVTAAMRERVVDKAPPGARVSSPRHRQKHAATPRLPRTSTMRRNTRMEEAAARRGTATAAAAAPGERGGALRCTTSRRTRRTIHTSVVSS